MYASPPRFDHFKDHLYVLCCHKGGLITQVDVKECPGVSLESNMSRSFLIQKHQNTVKSISKGSDVKSSFIFELSVLYIE